MTIEEELDLLNDVLKRVEDQIFTLDGPLMTTVKLKDSTFRRKEITGEDFFPGPAYISKTGVTILTFTPVNTLPDMLAYASIEVPSTEVDRFFPTLSEVMHETCKSYMPEYRAISEKASDLALSFANVFHTMVVVETERLEKSSEEDELAMISQPIFGMF